MIFSISRSAAGVSESIQKM